MKTSNKSFESAKYDQNSNITCHDNSSWFGGGKPAELYIFDTAETMVFDNYNVGWTNLAEP